MRPLKALAAAVVLASAPLAAAPAFAQNANVIVVDSGQILGQSAAGRDMTQRLEAIAQQMQGELQPEQTALQQEQQALAQATRGQSDEQVRANTQLAQRIEQFNRRAETFRQRQVQMARDLEYTQGQALVEFNRQITPIINEIMAARGATVVLDRRAILHRADAVDVTAEVLARLDERVRTIAVSRQSAPPPQQ